jgi:thiosulfate dehydrogenase [quinone] large subunit
MKPKSNPLRDLLAFLTNPIWPTAVFWVVLLAGLGIAFSGWQRHPAQRTPHAAGITVLRLIMGKMWWQPSLWKIPPNYDGLLFWMKQMVAHSSVHFQATMVDRIVAPNIVVFGPLVYLTEALIGVSLMLGVFTRLFAALGFLMALNLWVSLYSAPNELPWTYGYLIVIQALFVIDPPGRRLGLEKPVPPAVQETQPSGPDPQAALIRVSAARWHEAGHGPRDRDRLPAAHRLIAANPPAHYVGGSVTGTAGPRAREKPS